MPWISKKNGKIFLYQYLKPYFGKLTRNVTSKMGDFTSSSTTSSIFVRSLPDIKDLRTYFSSRANTGKEPRHVNTKSGTSELRFCQDSGHMRAPSGERGVAQLREAHWSSAERISDFSSSLYHFLLLEIRSRSGGR